MTVYSLSLKSERCIGCGTCMDVCSPRAIDMKRHTKKTAIEGDVLLYLRLNGPDNHESSPVEMLTFPYLAEPRHCDGCGVCVRECPVGALAIASTGTNAALDGNARSTA